MQGSEKLCLQWNDFKENTASAFGKLRENSEFSGVTLVCQDGRKVEAHKVMLASSSPFFMDLLSEYKHPHPFIYMRGLKLDVLLALLISSILERQTFGKHEKLEEFLALAAELKLKGLVGEEEQEHEGSSSKPKTSRITKRKPPVKLFRVSKQVFRPS